MIKNSAECWSTTHKLGALLARRFELFARLNILCVFIYVNQCIHFLLFKYCNFPLTGLNGSSLVFQMPLTGSSRSRQGFSSTASWSTSQPSCILLYFTIINIQSSFIFPATVKQSVQGAVWITLSPPALLFAKHKASLYGRWRSTFTPRTAPH